MRRIAFFGGSFDPPHRGHLAIAGAAADRFQLDTVLFAPTAVQPFKRSAPVTPFCHRYAMTVLATQQDTRFLPSLLDAPLDPDRGTQPNYTVETLERLRAALPAGAELFTLLGADSWAGIARWHRAEHLLALTNWIVAARPGTSIADAAGALPAGMASEHRSSAENEELLLHHSGGTTTRVFLMRDLAEDIAATSLRERLAQGIDVGDLLTPSVREYIRKTALYSTAPSG